MRPFPIDEFQRGLTVETEHASSVDENIITVARIVLDHLEERFDYYDKLEEVESNMKNDNDKDDPEKKVDSTNPSAPEKDEKPEEKDHEPDKDEDEEKCNERKDNGGLSPLGMIDRNFRVKNGWPL
jgi:hypothetical protein